MQHLRSSANNNRLSPSYIAFSFYGKPNRFTVQDQLQFLCLLKKSFRFRQFGYLLNLSIETYIYICMDIYEVTMCTSSFRKCLRKISCGNHLYVISSNFWSRIRFFAYYCVKIDFTPENFKPELIHEVHRGALFSISFCFLISDHQNSRASGHIFVLPWCPK